MSVNKLINGSVRLSTLLCESGAGELTEGYTTIHSVITAPQSALLAETLNATCGLRRLPLSVCE